YPMWFYFVSACSLTAAIWFIQEIDRRRLILFSLSVAIVIYTHYLGLVFSAALFLVLGFIIIFRRSKAWWQQIVSSTLLVGILISPLLLVLLKSVPSLVNTGYHFKAGFSLSKLIRAILVDWGFGYGLIPGHNLFAKLAAFSNALISRNWPDAVSIFQDGVGIALAATIVLGLNLAFTGYHLKRGPSLRVNSTILLGVPLLTFGVSQITNLNFFPLHFGIIAWGLLAFIVIGWVQSKHPILPFVLGICMLVVNGISLNHYYANLENKYPGKQLIIDYLNTHQPEFETAFVDDWITHVRGPAITPDELHPDIILLGFDSMANIPLGQVDETGTIVFLAGTWETIQAELEAVQATHSNFSWQLLETWPSLELAERSIHVVEVTYTAAD
ncbi:MAG: hypothetical protein OEZ02_12510, partial [Anaerolineae bacterium]|nr:hypothetical protein [Anaerolineae bacterium]